MQNQKVIIENILNKIPEQQTYGIKPATNEQIQVFIQRAKTNGVKEEIIEELVNLYRVANEFTSEVILAFHSCDSEIIFEWWEQGVLWLGQRDFNTIRWVNNKYYLGDAGNYSYSEKNEYDTLEDLLKGCIKEIKELENE